MSSVTAQRIHAVHMQWPCWSPQTSPASAKAPPTCPLLLGENISHIDHLVSPVVLYNSKIKFKLQLI